MQVHLKVSTITGICSLLLIISGEAIAIPNSGNLQELAPQGLVPLRYEDEPLCFMQMSDGRIMDLSHFCQPVHQTQQPQTPVLPDMPEGIQPHHFPSPVGDRPAMPYIPPSSEFAG